MQAPSVGADTAIAGVDESGIASQARSRLRSADAELLALRGRADRICPHEKIERLQPALPLGLLAARPHATDTREYRIAPSQAADHFARRALADLLQSWIATSRNSTQRPPADMPRRG